MSKVICSHVKKCGIEIKPPSKDDKEPSSVCSHAVPHEPDWTCDNHICLRVAPASIMCEPIKDEQK